MTWRAIMFLGTRMARRNHFYLFAWLCAIIVPGALQLASALIEDVRYDLLRGYFGVISFFMFFALTFGFGTVFAAYYMVSFYRRRGTVELLTVAQVNPRQVLTGVFAALQTVLAPPALGFCLIVVVYGLIDTADMAGWVVEGWELLGLVYLVLLNQAIISAMVCLGLMGREDIFAFTAVFATLILNFMPVILIFILNWQPWAYGLLLAGILAALLLLAWWFLRKRWPPRGTPRL